MSEEKAKYRVTRLSFIVNQLLHEGEEVEYDGEPGSALEPLNDAAKAAKKKAEEKHGKSEEVNPPQVSVISDSKPDSVNGEVSEELASLRQQYEELFDKKPGNKSAETMKSEIAAKRKELGV
ncbi:hypothetical protein ABVS80_001139 [Escherichia coli]|nr:hypothetical protein [Escherichia coli]